jgi:disulfide bond formation protein DsbB
MEKFCRFLNTLMIFVLVAILASAYYQQFSKHEEPCPLCLLQRLGMIGVATGAFLNLRFGIRPVFYGISILSALGGGAVSIRQILLHVCPGSPTFGTPVFGLGLYTWAFLAFAASLLGISFLLMMYHPTFKAAKMNLLEKFAAFLLILITFSNMITTFLECGFGVCVG